MDDFSRATWVYLLKDKTEACEHIVDYCRMVTTQFERHVKRVRSDNGTEFTKGGLQNYFLKEGILHETSCVDTPQQNGRVELKNRHLHNVARALLFQASLPIRFWGECVLTAAYLINYTPTKLHHFKSSYEVLFGKSPSYTHLRVFGCFCYVHTHGRIRDKFDASATRTMFIGYPQGQKGWRVFDLDTQRIFVSRDVIFHEDTYPFAQSPLPSPESYSPNRHISLYNSASELAPYPFVDPSSKNPLDDPLPLCTINSSASSPSPLESNVTRPIEPNATSPIPHMPPDPSGSTTLESRPNAELGSAVSQGELASRTGSASPSRPQRDRRPPAYLRDYVCHAIKSDTPDSSPLHDASSGTPHPLSHFVAYDKFFVTHRAYLASITSRDDPCHFSHAVQDPRWREAMAQEISALEANNTWELRPLPSGKKALGCKWVCKTKYNADGSVEHFKARLVTLGNHQVKGEDYHETFAPVAKMVTVRTSLTLAAAKGWHLHQMDVHNAFLHGDLHEDIYMKPPPGFHTTQSNVVCKLKKSFYGLRQAPHQWFFKLASALHEYGFQQSPLDHSLFTFSRGNIFLALLIYVDDLVLTGNDPERCVAFKDYLHRCFKLKDLGPLKYFLGIEVARAPARLFLC